MTKYKAIKTMVNGIKFDSRKEAKRYTELLLLVKSGKISELALQVPFELAPAVKLEGDFRKKPALRYVADFVYLDVEKGAVVVEDIKGMRTPMFRMKQHLMATVHGVQIVTI